MRHLITKHKNPMKVYAGRKKIWQSRSTWFIVIKMGMVIKAGAIILMSHHRLCFTLQVCPPINTNLFYISKFGKIMFNLCRQLCNK